MLVTAYSLKRGGRLAPQTATYCVPPNWAYQ